MSLDGRVAGPDGTPLQLTGPTLNQRTHELRAQVDAIVVGTGTALADDPRLTARLDEPVTSQPLRVVVGKRPTPKSARMRGQEYRQFTDHEPEGVLRELLAEGCLSVLVEGGPTLLRAWLRAGVVDEVRWTISPIILGAGPTVIGEDMQVIPVRVERTEVVGEDLLVVGAVSSHARG
jgi:diaminohydroxyphosphoribosylaminopyrimidine deaminase/5-amino-6-(5-phosphoribosylamino)uracil reductase